MLRHLLHLLLVVHVHLLLLLLELLVVLALISVHLLLLLLHFLLLSHTQFQLRATVNLPSFSADGSSWLQQLSFVSRR